MTAYPSLRAPILGMLVGLPVLGVGGRIVMRIISEVSGAPSAISLGGTITVLSAGAASGLAGGIIYGLLARFFPHGRVLRDLLFAAALVLLTLRGVNPVQPLSLSLFGPLVVAYGVLLEWVWHRAAHRVPVAQHAS
jgi:hypothetical protein